MLTASRGRAVCCETRREMTDPLSESNLLSKGGFVSPGQTTPVAQCSRFCASLGQWKAVLHIHMMCVHSNNGFFKTCLALPIRCVSPLNVISTHFLKYTLQQ